MAPSAAPQAAEVTWPTGTPSRSTSSPPHIIVPGSLATSDTSRRRGPSALAFSTASLPRKLMSVRSLQANPSPASTGP